MVVFGCDSCGDSLRKKDVQKHYQFACRNFSSVTCVDCKKQFWGDEYSKHTQCITDEQFKYGEVSTHKEDKGALKQNAWLANIDLLLAERSTDKRFVPILVEMKKYENVPRKKKPFMNWTRCTLKRFNHKQVEEVFDKLMEMQAKNVKKDNENGASNGQSGNVKRKVDDEEEEPAKKKSKRVASESEEMMESEEVAEQKSEKSLEKFKLKKCVAQILVKKGEPVKIKRLLKKILSEYASFVEERSDGGKVWSEGDIATKLEKLANNKKLFKNSGTTLQLTEHGVAKFTANPDSE